MKPRLKSSFARDSDDALQGRASVVVMKMTNNPHFSEPLPAAVPTLVSIEAARQTFQGLCIASANGDRIKIRERQNARATLEAMLSQLAKYVELVAQGDELILASSGFELRHPPVNSPGTTPLPAPTDFRVTHGRLSGTLDIHVRRLEGASLYDVETMPGNGNPDTDWKHVTGSTTSMHITIGGLTPGEYIWVRVRGLNSAGYGLWTEPIRIMVI